MFGSEGQVIGRRFVLRELVSRGVDDEIWRADDQQGEAAAAIKLIMASSMGDAGLVRFVERAQSVTRVNHPSLVPLLDFGMIPESVAYAAHAWCDGDSLTTWISDHGAIKGPLAWDVALQILEALGAAHAHGLTHGTLTPNKVIVRETRAGGMLAKVVDLGITASIRGTHAPREGFGVYAAPERISSDELSPATDLYSVAVLTCLIATGRDPATYETVADAVHSCPTLSAEAAELLHRALHNEPSDRPGSVYDLAAQLARCSWRSGDNKRAKITPAFGVIHLSGAPVSGEQHELSSPPAGLLPSNEPPALRALPSWALAKSGARAEPIQVSTHVVRPAMVSLRFVSERAEWNSLDLIDPSIPPPPKVPVGRFGVPLARGDISLSDAPTMAPSLGHLPWSMRAVRRIERRVGLPFRRVIAVAVLAAATAAAISAIAAWVWPA